VLIGASLSSAKLEHADLSTALLREANLSKAGLAGANLRNAKLSGANFSGANFSGANLRGAKGITNEKLDKPSVTLDGAIMPNGQKYEDWLKDKKAREEDTENE